MRPNHRSAREARRAGTLLLTGALTLLAACDFSVTNPGPMRDADLDDPAARAPLVVGMKAALSSALWRVALVNAEVSREYVQGGRIFTTKLPTAPGQLTREDVSDVFWERAVSARWIAEDGIERFRRTMPDSFATSPLAAEALITAGFANRLLGENFCEAVIDAGAPQPGAVYFDRAEEHFTEALAIAQAAGEADLVHAARAGRASVRVHLGDWAGAVEDASTVPDGFAYAANFHSTDMEQYNAIYWSNANLPFRTHSVVGTFYEDYYRETGDPRVAWGQDPQVPNAEIAAVPWLFQLKYDSNDDDINLVSGREMRLIEAEAALRRQDLAGSTAVLNTLRASVTSDQGGALAPWPQPATTEEAWAQLKRERGIELWLEGRRLGDLRRWVADGSPARAEDVSDRIRLCFPVAQSEIDTNPNIELQHPDPVSPAYTG